MELGGQTEYKGDNDLMNSLIFFIKKKRRDLVLRVRPNEVLRRVYMHRESETLLGGNNGGGV